MHLHPPKILMPFVVFSSWNFCISQLSPVCVRPFCHFQQFFFQLRIRDNPSWTGAGHSGQPGRLKEKEDWRLYVEQD